MTRNELLNAQPSLQKLVAVELPMDEAFHVAELIDKVNPILMNEEIKEFEMDKKIEVTLLHDIRLSPSDIKYLSLLIDFKEG